MRKRTEPDFRFYTLYDKIYRQDIPAHAYDQCRSNKGAPGMHGQDFADVVAYGRACTQRGELSTGTDQTCAYPQGPWHAQAAGYVNPAGSKSA